MLKSLAHAPEQRRGTPTEKSKTAAIGDLAHGLLRVIVAAALVSCSASSAPAQIYGVVDLGTVGGFSSDAFSVNSAGHVVGVSSNSSADFRGFFRDTALTAIAPLSGSQSHAFDVNAANQVAVASYSLGDTVAHGLRWQNGAPTNLGNIAPRGINAAGEIAGSLSTLDPNFGWVDHAAYWQNGNIIDLGTLGGHFSYAHAIADDGRIVGMSYNLNDTNTRATIWLGGIPHDLGTLGGSNSQAFDINNSRHVVGVAETSAGQPHGFLFTLDLNANVLSRTDLGVLGGGYSYAYGINNSDVVVGASNGAAFRWQAGTIADLNSLIPACTNWRLDAARAINDNGQIVGAGLHEGQPRGFLLTSYRYGDVNCDGAVNGLDIGAFVDALLNELGYEAQYTYCNRMLADIDHNGVVEFADVGPLVALLTTN